MENHVNYNINYDGVPFSQLDRQRLRSLAGKVAQIAALPIQQEKAKLWTAHNDLQTSEPVVFIDPENGWHECIPDSQLECTHPLARAWEFGLLKRIYWHEHLKDDRVEDAFFDVPVVHGNDGFGVDIQLTKTDKKDGAYHIEQVIQDYEEDFPKLHYPNLFFDFPATQRLMDMANDLLGDLLTVRQKTSWYWSLGMTWDYIDLRGFEDFMCDFLVEPDYVHKMMDLLCSGILRRLDLLEEKGILCPNSGNTYVGSGGFGFTNQLPSEESLAAGAKTSQMWGFVESQETVSINPDLYGEFIFPYHQRIAQRFGLMCYGCCEPYDPRWKYVKQLSHLRRVSCSPWADWTTIPENLGNHHVASIKPNPALLAVPNMEEDAVREQIKKALDCSRGCVPELIMKDNHTLGGHPENASRWVEIVREEIGKL